MIIQSRCSSFTSLCEESLLFGSVRSVPALERIPQYSKLREAWDGRKDGKNKTEGMTEA